MKTIVAILRIVVVESRSAALRAAVAAVFALLPSTRVASPAKPPVIAKMIPAAGGPESRTAAKTSQPIAAAAR